ncbi:carbohydrate porin [Sphingomonas sp. TX0543]|uniref:carbohydrate porin n=2 Tax=unclassified Sphingomonas TaxID=196159 RepID=UPI00148572E7
MTGKPFYAAATGCLFMFALPAFAQAADQPAQDWAIHGQATLVVQGVGGFASPYGGANSLAPRQVKETVDATAFIGARPWKGAELWANPEMDQGFGLSNTLGVAGFPSAEAYKVGRASPYFRLQRLFVRQTIGLGGARENVAPGANQLGGMRDVDRIVITAGKFGVGDVFDTNAYAHDPRGDFLNWAAVDAGTFDYAADAWGYSTGIAAELYRGAWALRIGGFNLSKVPNGETLERDFSQYQIDAEIEHRHAIAGHPGAVRVTLFRNRGRFSRFDDALALAQATGNPLDPALTRRPMTRIGVHFNLEQELTSDLGLFARAGIADGAIEPYDFTDIDRSAQIGAVLRGSRWRRKDDRIGLALIANGISAAHRRYLDAGGIGVLIGDGRLPHAGAEQIAELFYAARITPALEATIDAQHIANPGYNRDRGPANVLALRLHAAF